MSRKVLSILSICFVAATALVVVLYAATRKIVHERNPFLREYAKLAAVKASTLDLGLNSYYIAGITSDHVYLGNITAPFRLIVSNLTLTDTQHVKLKVRATGEPVVYKNSFVRIDSPYFYLADGETPTLYRGRIGEWLAGKFLAHETYFTQLEPIGYTSFAVRTNLSSTLDNVLGKLQQDTPYIKLEKQLIQRQVDGIFCTDGVLDYNDDIGKVIYAYYYRNEFIVCDTSLNLEYRGHTIDTFSRAQVKVGHISSDGKRVLMDRKYVNKGIATSGENLFVNSNVLARNDVRYALERSSIVDVYNLRNATYRFSFVIRNNGESKIRQFYVVKNRFLFALSGHEISRYDLRAPYFAPVNKNITDQ